MKNYSFIVLTVACINLSGASYKKSTADKHQASFINACRNGDVLTAQHCITIKKLDPNKPDYEGSLPLSAAIAADQSAIVSYLLSLPTIQIVMENRTYCSPLQIAFLSHNTGYLKTLLAHQSIKQNKDTLKNVILSFVEFIHTPQAEELKTVAEYLPALYTLVNNLSREIKNSALNFVEKRRTQVTSTTVGFSELNPVHYAFSKKSFLIARALMLLGADLTWKPSSYAQNASFLEFIANGAQTACFRSNPLYIQSVAERLYGEDYKSPDEKQMKKEYDLLNKKNICVACAEQADNHCSSCKLAYYCSVGCQKVDFPAHKDTCRKTKKLRDMMKPD